MRRIFLFVIFLLLFFSPTKVIAEDFVIDSFGSDITVLENGEVEVVETINVDFSSNQKHGIFRDIPFAYSKNGEMHYTEIEVSNILRNNQIEKYEITKNDANIRIRLGDPGKTISSKQSYVIKYSAKGVLSTFSNSSEDELYWNVTGDNWGTTISRVNAKITLTNPGLEQVGCYQGVVGSDRKCVASARSEFIADFSGGPLNSFEGMTVVASFKKGLFPIITILPPEKYPFLKWEYFYVFLTTSLIGIALVLGHWYKEGRDIWSPIPILLGNTQHGKNKPIGRSDIITVEFEPPEKLRPAELGVLLDERADTLDVTATIIDLAGRGFLHIKEIEKSWVFGKTDYELNKNKKDTSNLLAYEKTLLTHLFETGDTVKLSQLKMTFYEELKEVKAKLYQTVVEKGFFPEDPEKRRTNFLVIAVILSVASFFLFMNLLTHFYILSFLGGIIISSLFLLIFSRSMSRRSLLGSDLYRRALGYKQFIGGAEKYRQQFFEKKNLLNEILPYTIVFGLTDKFAKATEKMGIKSVKPSWYTGAHYFTFSSFASDMNSFSSSLSSAISSAPSSSGTSGGSSGGGFGGGGGGSW